MGKKILIIDDNEGLLAVYKEILELDGYEVTTQSNAKLALDALIGQQSRYDLILIDCMMPVLSGEEVLEILRSEDPDLFARTPVVALSSLSAGSPLTARTERLASHFVEKPLDLDDFLGMVKQYAV